MASFRIKREKKTISSMIALYCHFIHGSESQLCENCQFLMDYACSRLDRCPFQEGKPTCTRCTVHCFQTPMRKQVKEIMRFSGPRMMVTHPILTLYHLFDGLKRPGRKNEIQPMRKPFFSKSIGRTN